MLERQEVQRGVAGVAITGFAELCGGVNYEQSKPLSTAVTALNGDEPDSEK